MIMTKNYEIVLNYINKNNYFYPLSGVSNTKTIYCNENGYYSMYQSDNILDNSDLEIMSNKLLITSYFVDYSKLLMESLGIFPVDEM